MKLSHWWELVRETSRKLAGRRNGTCKVREAHRVRDPHIAPSQPEQITGVWPGPSGGEAEELYRSRSLSAFQVRFRSVNSSCKQRKVSKQEVDGQMSH